VDRGSAGAPPDRSSREREAFDRAWRRVSRWVVPAMMALAYFTLAQTSGTGTVGKIWIGFGLIFVLIAWFVFSALTEAAGLARTLATGDTVRLLALADRDLARTRDPAARARLLVARGFAHLLRGEFTEALAAIDQAQSGQTEFARTRSGQARSALELRSLARAVRASALVELGRPLDAVRGPVVGSPRAPAMDRLAEAQIAWRDGQLDAAAQQFGRVIDDIRAGAAVRAIAHLYAARIAEARGDRAAAVRHRAASVNLAAPDARWLRAPLTGST
jgi:hypothetical protein